MKYLIVEKDISHNRKPDDANILTISKKIFEKKSSIYTLF